MRVVSMCELPRQSERASIDTQALSSRMVRVRRHHCLELLGLPKMR
ncbi:MAG: hypothetical protein IJU79_05065 [Desulfovibrionaceae bacterium]|nr:hypothetical protein [Desulfovibrionaceae bacterium]